MILSILKKKLYTIIPGWKNMIDSYSFYLEIKILEGFF